MVREDLVYLAETVRPGVKYHDGRQREKRREAEVRLEGTTFGFEGGISVIRRIRERRKTDGTWPGFDGRKGRRVRENDKDRGAKMDGEGQGEAKRERNGLGMGDRVGAGGRSTAPCMG